MGFDVEAFLRAHAGTLLVAGAVLAALFLVTVRAYDRRRALFDALSNLARARAWLEARRAAGSETPLLPSVESLEARLRRIARAS